MCFNPVELLEMTNNWENEGRRIIFHEFGVEQPNKPARTARNKGNKDNRIISYVFGLVENSQTAWSNK